MQVIEIKDQEKWNEFVASSGRQFLQSWEWGEFQKKLDRKTWRLGMKHDNNIIGQALVVKHTLPLKKSYLYCPRGPLFHCVQSNAKCKMQNAKLLNLFFEKVKDLAKQENSIFLRIEPLAECRMQNEEFRMRKVKDVQPSQTLMLNLVNPEEKILSQMHEKTRYNIRLAQRYGVRVCESNDVETFLNLIHLTAKRENFNPHPDIYYFKLLDIGPYFIKLYTATYKGKVLAAHMMIFFGNTAAYIHGASSREYKEVMVPHLLHWYIIQEVKKHGYKMYDFWGIDEKKWPGLTRFKKGFGGKVVNYPGTFDIPLSKTWYYLYRLGTSCRSYLQ